MIATHSPVMILWVLVCNRDIVWFGPKFLNDVQVVTPYPIWSNGLTPRKDMFVDVPNICWIPIASISFKYCMIGSKLCSCPYLLHFQGFNLPKSIWKSKPKILPNDTPQNGWWSPIFVNLCWRSYYLNAVLLVDFPANHVRLASGKLT